jgi:hypothetical protein
MKILFGPDACPVANLVRWVQNDFFTIRKPTKDLCFRVIALTDLDIASFRSPVLDRKYVPALSLPPCRKM